MSFFQKLMHFFSGIHKHPDDDCYVVTVEKGDSLWHIAEELTGDGARWREMQPLNPGLDEHDVIKPGDELRIPKEWAE